MIKSVLKFLPVSARRQNKALMTVLFLCCMQFITYVLHNRSRYLSVGAHDYLTKLHQPHNVFGVK